MGQTARRTFVITIVVASVVVLLLLLWKLKEVVFLLFLAFTAVLFPAKEVER